MKISARNVLKGTIVEITKGATTSHVRLDIGGSIVTDVDHQRGRGRSRPYGRRPGGGRHQGVGRDDRRGLRRSRRGIGAARGNFQSYFSFRRPMTSSAPFAAAADFAARPRGREPCPPPNPPPPRLIPTFSSSVPARPAVARDHAPPSRRERPPHRPRGAPRPGLQGARLVEREPRGAAGMGVVETFLEAGARLNALVIGDGDRELARLAVGDGIDSPFPFPLLLAQSRTEDILTARLASLGTAIEREVEFATPRPGRRRGHGDGEATGRRRGDRARRLSGRLRRRPKRGPPRLDIPFEGFTEPATYLLGDVRFSNPPLDHRSIYLWWHQGGTIALFPFGDDLWRIFRGACRRRRRGDAGHRRIAGPPRPPRAARAPHHRGDLALGLPHQRPARAALSRGPRLPRRDAAHIHSPPAARA